MNKIQKQVEKIALSLADPPYSIADVIKIQVLAEKKHGLHLSYGEVSDIIPRGKRVRNIEKQIGTDENGNPVKILQDKECIHCGMVFTAKGLQRVCTDCTVSRKRRTAKAWCDKYRKKDSPNRDKYKVV